MSNFWAEFSFPSPVDDILKKPNFTIEELLDEDDVVVDIKSQKEELKEYMLKKENLTKLVQYVCQEPADDASDNAKFRYPLIAVEILTAEVEEIDRALTHDDELLDMLANFFQNPNASHILANLVVRVFSSLLDSRLSGVLQYIKKEPQFLSNVIPFVHLAPVFDFLHRLVIDVENEYEGRGTVEWLASIDFHKTLLSKFTAECQAVHPELSRLVVEIILTSTETSRLLEKILLPESLEILFENIFKAGNLSGFRYGLTVVSYMLRSLNPDFRGDELLPTDAPVTQLPWIIQKVLSLIPDLLPYATSPPVSREITNQSGQKLEAFGFIRLSVLQCIDNLLALGYTKVIKEVVSSHIDVYSCALRLMIQFHSNNFCHLVVGRIFASTISLSDDNTALEFLQKSGLPQALLLHTNDVAPSGGRPLYAPFIQRIGYMIIDRQQTLDKLYSLLANVEGWEDFAAKSHEERLKYTQLNPFGESFEEDTDDKTMSLSEESDDSSNDANDYDTDQAEILLSKLEIEASA